ncbi:MAG: redoxin family protein [Planctomycetes bacterium]|nr:redoxin family protein [Planctomycetota bacterium]
MQKHWVACAVLALAAGTAHAAADQNPWAAMFPEGLQDVNGNPVDPATLKGKMVGLYFSAHWCPPCRAFTPKLVEFRNANAAGFEIVFVSSDKSPADQKKYMTETKMQWPTIKLNGDTSKKLKQEHGIRGIPSLIILGPDGNVVTKDGRGDVMSNPSGALAKWSQKK